MRGFFILLLLTNLLFFGWQFWFAPEVEQPDPYGGIVAANKGLVLLSELEESAHPPQRQLAKAAATDDEQAQKVELIEPEVRVEELPEVEEAASPAIICYSSMPLAASSDVKALKAELAKIGIKETGTDVVDTRMSNYWVMLAPYKSRAKAKEAATILKQKKVKDFFIVVTGEYENAVSLGVYSSRERADIRYKQIASLKARLRKPVIEQLDLPAKRSVIRFKLDEGSEPDGLADMLESTDEPKLKKIPCK